jgi:dolichol kinase
LDQSSNRSINIEREDKKGKLQNYSTVQYSTITTMIFVHNRRQASRKTATSATYCCIKFLVVQYCLAVLICFTSASTRSSAQALSPLSPHHVPFSKRTPPTSSTGTTTNMNKNKRSSSSVLFRSPTSEEIELSESSDFDHEDNIDGNNQHNTDIVDEINSEVSLSTATAINIDDGASIESSKRLRWNRRKQIALGLLGSIIVTASAAKMGYLLGPPIIDVATASSTSTLLPSFGIYTNSMILRDVISTMSASVLAVILNRCITWGFENQKYDSKFARKLTHTLSAPLFIVFWPLFSNAQGAKYFASLVTLTNILRLYLAGTGDAAESSLAKSISRSGDQAEVLGGPFIYVCCFQLFLVIFWRTSFVGVVAMTTMAAGDGMADIIGRKYGRHDNQKWSSYLPNFMITDQKKSIIGTVAFALSAFVCTFGVVMWLIATGCLTSTSLSVVELASRIFLIGWICAFIEILPLGDDNYTVPGSAAVLAALLLR